MTPQPPLERTEPEPPVATTTPSTVAETSSTTERQAQTEEVARAASSTSDPEAMKVPPPSPVMPTEARTSPRVNFLLISFIRSFHKFLQHLTFSNLLNFIFQLLQALSCQYDRILNVCPVLLERADNVKKSDSRNFK